MFVSAINYTQGDSPLSPSSWLTVSAPTADTPVKTGVWPWAKMEIDQWIDLLKSINRLKTFLNSMIAASNILNLIGFVGSFLILYTVFSKRKMVRNAFYLTLIVVAILDAVFVSLKFTRWIITLMSQPAPPAAATLFYNYASGVAYTCSLMSDMLTLSLTLERFVALAAPIFYKTLSKDRKLAAWVVLATTSLLVASTRMHYSFDNFTYESISLQNQAWFETVSYFSDTVVPFLSTTIMIFLVAGVVRAVCKRKKQQKLLQQQSSNVNAEDRKRERDTAKTISLLAALSIMFFMNQIGYMLYGVVVKVKSWQQVTYFSSYAEIERYSNIYIFYKVGVSMSAPLEIFSRSLVFYTYVSFSGGFRADFLNAFRRFLFCINGHSQIAPSPIANAPVAGEQQRNLMVAAMPHANVSNHA